MKPFLKSAAIRLWRVPLVNRLLKPVVFRLLRAPSMNRLLNSVFHFHQVELQKKETNEWDISADFEARSRKQEWIHSHLCCPQCDGRLRTPIVRGKTIQCRDCDSEFPQRTHSLHLIHSDNIKNFEVEPTLNVSKHLYDEIALEIIADVRKRNGKILDCGAGLRAYPEETVITCEIVDYPTTDVICAGQAIPFQDASFDAVFSLNVLEHVNDPFLCASEIMRVLKPEGRLYCVVPFLQPEHGYPNHYYNMTRSGLLHLFKSEITPERNFVHPSGRPMWTLHWFLSVYLQNLPSPTRDKFSNMKVQDILAKDPISWVDAEWVTELSDQANWTLACTTTLVGRKREA